MDLLIVIEAPLLKDHITLCVTPKTPQVPGRNPVAGSFVPIYGRCSCTPLNGLYKEKNYGRRYSIKLPRDGGATVSTLENIREP
jgi:hypothetical protein